MSLGRTNARTARALALLVLPGAFAPAGAAAAEGGPTRLSPASYGVAPLCSPPAPGHSACLGVSLIAKAPLSLRGARALVPPRGGAGGASAQATPATEFKQPLEGLAPADVRGAYGVAAAPPPAITQTIGIVDAYDDPTAEADLAQFSNQFGLPACTTENGCFRKLNQSGKASPLPPFKETSEERGWALEIATDIETAHAVCPSCHILLVEANSSSNANLFPAENTAAGLLASEISNSWGGPEPASDSPSFNHPGIVITASAGDSGYLNWLTSPHYVNYPASSPHVVAVGGTRLLQSKGVWYSESVWNDGAIKEGKSSGAGATGGGCSSVFAAPLWQQAVADWSAIGCVRRAVADVSADGDPYTGVDVYDSTPTPSGNKGWAIVGGTSVASPIIASVFALAGGAHGVEYPARTLYENAASLRDVTSGSNGECGKPFNEFTGASGCTSAEEAASCSARGICLAGVGYDGPSGVGTPNGLAPFGGPGQEGAGRELAGNPPGAAASGAGAPQPSPAPSRPPPAAAAVLPAISALALTRGARAALRHRRPRISVVRFSFTLDAPASITATLARLTKSHGRRRWRVAARPLAFAARRGSQRSGLSGRARLPRGRYQLTLTPARGAPVSIVFLVA
jgi:hypothetical protein